MSRLLVPSTKLCGDPTTDDNIFVFPILVYVSNTSIKKNYFSKRLINYSSKEYTQSVNKSKKEKHVVLL